MIIESVNLLQNYQSTLNSYDEVLDKDGRIKPYWNTLFATLEKLGMEELKVRNQEVISKLRENGVTYNVYEGTEGLNRPWILDPIPFLIEQKEWNQISKGLQQRAILMDMIFKDIYGPRNLVKNGVIPAELVFANNGFLRSCHDVKLPGETQLVLCAIDMARGPDGQMWVVDNRTQAPSGTGYALENRSVMSKLLPEMADGMYVNKLSPYFNAFQDSILKYSSRSKEGPNIVYLTPGPNNEAYFEHAYLASYLGYTLAQGEDLVVRDGSVWLKSIDGLEKVDVIIRRIDDDWCDPLELREDSKLGVPGLLQAIRLGNVKVLNPPGSGVLENHAFLAFMSNICKYFLNEDLIMPSIATWWCGHEKELNFVLGNIDKLIIKKANRKSKFRSIYGRLLSFQEREQLKLQIQKAPFDYIAQEEVSLSTTPSLIDGNIVPRYAALRGFLVAEDNGYRVMQGGLTRSSPVKDRFQVSNQYGGLSKDTWIVSDKTRRETEKISILSQPAVKKHVSLPSRSAESLFWVGRYCERTVSSLKFINIVINALNQERYFSGSMKKTHINILLKALTNLTATYPGFIEDESKRRDPYPEIINIVSDSTLPGSIVSNISYFLNSVAAVRNQWDIEIWRIVDVIEHGLINARKGSQMNSSNIQRTIDSLNNSMVTFIGVIGETMPRDKGYLLLDTGKLIERILSRISVIQSCFGIKHDTSIENEFIEVVLQYHHLLVNYRQIYKSQLSVEAMIDMVLLETSLPYSMVHMLDELSSNLSKLSPASKRDRLNEAERAVLEASTLIKLSDINSLNVWNSANERETLFELLSKVKNLIFSVSVNLTNLYFSHTVMQHSFLKPMEDNEI